MTRAVPEWIGKAPDTPIPPRVKLRVFERDGGRCKECTRKVGPGHMPFQIDHATAIINRGENRESNLQVLCSHCHAIKTGQDVAEKSKVARVRSKHLGIKKPSRFPGSRGSKFKQKIGGGVVYRDTGEPV